MKATLLKPTARAAGSMLLAGLLLTGWSAHADVKKGAAAQREMAQATSTGARSAASATPTACAVCCPPDKRASETIVVTTGSQIPTTSKKRLQITNGAQNLQVLDRKQLERTGSVNVTEAVRRLVP